LALEHPLETIRVQLQANERVAASKIVKSTFQRFGFKGFYAGFTPNMCRCTLKNMYRWPLMIYCPDLAKRMLSKKVVKKYDGIHKICGGFMIAMVDAVLLCPFDRLKVYLMTNFSKDRSLRNIFMSPGKLRSVFVGLDLQIYRQVLSWITFLFFEYRFRNLAKEMKGIEKNQLLDIPARFLASSAVGVINCLIILPVDMLKTRYQMAGHDLTLVRKRSISATAKQIYKEGGLRHFYAGWNVRILQYLVQSFAFGQLMDFLETRKH